MVDYIMISGAALCIAGQFTFNKLYEKKIVKGTLHLFLFPVLTAAVSALLIFFLNGFTLRWGSFTAGLAAANAVVSILSLLCGIVVVRYGSVAVYTMFMMMGGMFLPYVFGLIFLDEKATVCRIIGMVVLIAALILSAVPQGGAGKGGQANRQGGAGKTSQTGSGGEPAAEKTKPRKLFYLLCAAVFVLNGSVSILSKVHQTNAAALSEYDYMLWNYIFLFALACVSFGVCYALSRKKGAGEIGGGKAFGAACGVSAGYAVISSLGFLLLMRAAKTLPASVMYPFSTGGSIILTTLAARIFFKEKIGVLTWCSLALMLAGTVLFIF